MRRNLNLIASLGVAILFSWLFLPLVHFFGDTLMGIELKTGFVYFPQIGSMFLPGLLVPIFAALCVIFALLVRQTHIHSPIILGLLTSSALLAGFFSMWQGGIFLIPALPGGWGFEKPGICSFLLILFGIILVIMALESVSVREASH